MFFKSNSISCKNSVSAILRQYGMVANILQWISNFYPLLIHLLLLNLCYPVDLSTCKYSWERYHAFHSESFYQIVFFPLSQKRLVNMKGLNALGEERIIERMQERETGSKDNTSCFSILVRGSNAIIHLFIYSIIKHLLSVNNLLFLPSFLPKRNFCVTD